MLITAESKAHLAENVDTLLAESTANYRINAVIAGATSDKEVLYLKAQGVRDVESKVPVETNDLIDFYSGTKIFTNMALMKLYEEGKVNFDIPARTYLPEISKIELIDAGTVDKKTGRFTVPPRKPMHEVTVRHLALHTAGFCYFFLNSDYEALGKNIDPEIMYNEPNREYFSTPAMPLLHEPGTKWVYGVNTDWIGFIIEEITGMPLDMYVKKVIFDPIGMTSCTYRLKDMTNVLKVHQRKPDSSLELYPHKINSDPKLLRGGQGCYGSVSDLFKMFRVLLNDGYSPDSGLQIFEKETVQYAIQNHIPTGIDVEIHGMTPSKDIPGYIPDGFTLTGNAYSKNNLPTGRPKGSIYWGGFANLFHWIDFDNKIAGFWGAQVYPYNDKYCESSAVKFEKMVYDNLKTGTPKL